MSYFLGIDVGTSGSRALICDSSGKVKSVGVAEYSINSPKPGWSEQNSEQWWRAVCKSTDAALNNSNIKAQEIKAIGLTGQMHSTVFLDKNSKPLRPAILWNDQRTAAQCQTIEKLAGSKQRLIEMVGNPPLTGFSAPKILWIKENEPKVFEQTKKILLPKDYIRLRMTGEFATDVGDASGTLLLDVKKRKWNDDILATLKIDKDLLPRCFESYEITGALQKKAAEQVGLKAGTPVVAGSGDQPAGAVGNGIVKSGLASAAIGTSGAMFASSAQPHYDKLGRVHTMCAADGKWCVFGCMLSAGGSLQWFVDNLALEEKRAAKQKAGNPYSLLMDKASRAKAGSEGLFFLPYLTGERCPHPDPSARGAWIGLTVNHDRSAIIRSVIEGITFGMADMLEIIEQMNINIDTIRLSGGGAKSELWRTIQADIYNKPVATINSEQGPAYGAALLAGVGIGAWEDVGQVCEIALQETSRNLPDINRAGIYARQHKKYQKLYNALKDQFSDLSL